MRNIALHTDASGHVRHWHVSTSQCLSTIKEERQTLAAAFAPDGLSFATAGSDNKVYIYDEVTHKLVKTLEPRSVHCMHGGFFNVVVSAPLSIPHSMVFIAL